MFSLKKVASIVATTICLTLTPHAAFGSDASDAADLAQALATASRTNLLAPAERAKLEAETAKLWAEAMRAIAEAGLTDARTQQIYAEMAALYQRMRIAEYEFQRITAADFNMNRAVQQVHEHANLARSLVLGRSNWKTWIGLEALMESVGDAAVISQVMFEIPVPELPASEFVANGYGRTNGDLLSGFPGGNLGQLYSFARNHDLSFRQYGPAHQFMMKVVAMISTSAERRIDELRSVNQAIRFTIAAIRNT